MPLRLRRIPLALAGLLSLLPATAHAFSISSEWAGVLCGLIPCSQGGGGAAGLSNYVLTRIVTAMEIGFVAATVLALLFSTANMVINSADEGAVTAGRSTFIHAMVGAAVVGLSRWLVIAFSPVNTGAQLVNQTVFDDAVLKIVTFMRLILAVALTLNITIQAIRLVASQGEQEVVERARKRLLAGFVGVVFVLIANVIVVSINPTLGQPTGLAVEIAGIANYLITLLGFGAVLCILIAGVMLIISVDEGLRDKAKSLVKGAIVALIVALVAYAFVTAFITL